MLGPLNKNTFRFARVLSIETRGMNFIFYLRGIILYIKIDFKMKRMQQ